MSGCHKVPRTAGRTPRAASAYRSNCPRGAQAVAGFRRADNHADEGGGTREAITSCRESRVATPRFINTSVQFTVLFPRGSRSSAEHDARLEDIGSNTRLSPTEEDLLVNLQALGKNVPRIYQALSATGSGITVNVLAANTGLSTGQVRYGLAPLLREGIVTMEGGQGDRATVYRIVQSVN